MCARVLVRTRAGRQENVGRAQGRRFPDLGGGHLRPFAGLVFAVQLVHGGHLRGCASSGSSCFGSCCPSACCRRVTAGLSAGVFMAQEGSSPEQMRELPGEGQRGAQEEPGGRASFSPRRVWRGARASSQGLMFGFPQTRQAAPAHRDGHRADHAGAGQDSRHHRAPPTQSGVADQHRRDQPEHRAATPTRSAASTRTRSTPPPRSWWPRCGSSPGFQSVQSRLLQQDAEPQHRHRPRPRQSLRGVHREDREPAAQRVFGELRLPHQAAPTTSTR